MLSARLQGSVGLWAGHGDGGCRSNLDCVLVAGYWQHTDEQRFYQEDALAAVPCWLAPGCWPLRCLPLHPQFYLANASGKTSLRCHYVICQSDLTATIAFVHAAAGFARVYITDGGLMNSFAISSALFCIVMTSVVTGTVLPFGLAMAGIDPANAGTTIQVRICCVCTAWSCVQPLTSLCWARAPEQGISSPCSCPPCRSGVTSRGA